MNNINKGGVGGVQAGDGVGVVEVGLGGVQAGDAGQGEAVGALQNAARPPAEVCAETVPDQVEGRDGNVSEDLGNVETRGNEVVVRQWRQVERVE